MNWDLDLVRMGERLKEKEIRLLRLRRPTAGEQEGKNHNRHWSLIEIYNNLIIVRMGAGSGDVRETCNKSDSV